MKVKGKCLISTDLEFINPWEIARSHKEGEVIIEIKHGELQIYECKDETKQEEDYRIEKRFYGVARKIRERMKRIILRKILDDEEHKLESRIFKLVTKAKAPEEMKEVMDIYADYQRCLPVHGPLSSIQNCR